MREYSAHTTATEASKERYSRQEAAVISLAWQNMLKRWFNQADSTIDELRALMIKEIDVDSGKQINPDTLPFLLGTTREQDIEEYNQFIQGTLIDLSTSYIITQHLISHEAPKGPRPASAIKREEDQQYIDG